MMIMMISELINMYVYEPIFIIRMLVIKALIKTVISELNNQGYINL